MDLELCGMRFNQGNTLNHQGELELNLVATEPHAAPCYQSECKGSLLQLVGRCADNLTAQCLTAVKLPYHIVSGRLHNNMTETFVDRKVVEAQLMNPYIPTLNKDSPFGTYTNFPSAREIVEQPAVLQNIDTCFPNFATAEEYMRCSIPQSEQIDPTIPTDPESQRQLVALLSRAIQSTPLARDKDEYIHRYEASCYDPRVVEYRCWELLHSLMDSARSAGPIASIYSATGEKSRSRTQSKDQYLTFHDRFDAARHVLQQKKSVCAQILDSSAIMKLSDGPLGRIHKSIENQRVNDQKREDIAAGKKARNPPGEVDPPRRRARKRKRAESDGIDHDATSDRPQTLLDGVQQPKLKVRASLNRHSPQASSSIVANTGSAPLSTCSRTAIETPSFITHYEQGHRNSINTTSGLSNFESPGNSGRRPSWTSTGHNSVNSIIGSQPTSHLEWMLPNTSNLHINPYDVLDSSMPDSRGNSFYNAHSSPYPPLPDLGQDHLHNNWFSAPFANRELGNTEQLCLPTTTSEFYITDPYQSAGQNSEDIDFLSQVGMNFS